MRALVCLLLPAAVFAADAPKKDAADRDRIQGTWVCQSAEQGGAAVPAERAKEFKMTFKGDKFTLAMPGGREHQGTFKLAPGEKPRHLTITPDDGAGELKAVYELDGDTLKVCGTDPGGERPKDFATKSGDHAMSFVLKRQKP
jgi:uncharacterized protein (TIGR03067 family)